MLSRHTQKTSIILTKHHNMNQKRNGLVKYTHQLAIYLIIQIEKRVIYRLFQWKMFRKTTQF